MYFGGIYISFIIETFFAVDIKRCTVILSNVTKANKTAIAGGAAADEAVHHKKGVLA